MDFKRIVGVGVVAAALVAVPAAQGSKPQGSDPHANAQLGTLEMANGGKKATIKVTYKCAEGDALWVSAKQTDDGERDKKLKKEGSSETAAAWLDSHRNQFVCDGSDHTAKFTVDKVEKGTKGKLVRGEAWIQFCVTQGGRDLVLSKSAWVDVR